jgi:hypothetical protein
MIYTSFTTHIDKVEHHQIYIIRLVCTLADLPIHYLNFNSIDHSKKLTTYSVILFYASDLHPSLSKIEVDPAKSASICYVSTY